MSYFPLRWAKGIPFLQSLYENIKYFPHNLFKILLLWQLVRSNMVVIVW